MLRVARTSRSMGAPSRPELRRRIPRWARHQAHRDHPDGLPSRRPLLSRGRLPPGPGSLRRLVTAGASKWLRLARFGVGPTRAASGAATAGSAPAERTSEPVNAGVGPPKRSCGRPRVPGVDHRASPVRAAERMAVTRGSIGERCGVQRTAPAGRTEASASRRSTARSRRGVVRQPRSTARSRRGVVRQPAIDCQESPELARQPPATAGSRPETLGSRGTTAASRRRPLGAEKRLPGVASSTIGDVYPGLSRSLFVRRDRRERAAPRRGSSPAASRARPPPTSAAAAPLSPSERRAWRLRLRASRRRDRRASRARGGRRPRCSRRSRAPSSCARPSPRDARR